MTDTTSTVENDRDAPIRFMQQVISLDYVVRTSPINRTSASSSASRPDRRPQVPVVRARLRAARGGSARSASSRRARPTRSRLADQGIVTSWTVLTPIQYHGQTEREDYALASILLDGADGTIGQQRLVDVELDQIRMGMRVEAVWADEDAGAGRRRPRLRLRQRHHGFAPDRRARRAPDAYEKHTL